MHASEAVRAWLAIVVVLLTCVVAVWWLRSGLPERIARRLTAAITGWCPRCYTRIRGRLRLRGKCEECGWIDRGRRMEERERAHRRRMETR